MERGQSVGGPVGKQRGVTGGGQGVTGWGLRVAGWGLGSLYCLLSTWRTLQSVYTHLPHGLSPCNSCSCFGALRMVACEKMRNGEYGHDCLGTSSQSGAFSPVVRILS